MLFLSGNRRAFLLLAAASGFFLLSGLAVFAPGCSKLSQGTRLAPTDPVSPEMMQEDFEYVVEKLSNVHPMTIGGFPEAQKRIMANIQEIIREPQTKEAFFFLVNELFHSFHDAHTTMWLVFSRGIDLPLIWLRDGLYVERDTDVLKRGDRILSLGGQTVPRLCEKLNQILWTENNHLVRLEGTWMLTSRPYLQHLGLIDHDRVDVAYLRAGRERRVPLPIIELERPARRDGPFLFYSIDQRHDLALLTLNACRYDGEYRQKLRRFFEDLHEQRIGHIALDLRENPGGDSRVIDEFLRYMCVDRIKGYGSKVRYSQDACLQTKVLKFGLEEFPRAEHVNRKVDPKELLFSGRLFVLTSPHTFSSANMFAATIQDNRIGTIVGEPTGNQPSCYGHPLSFQMPRTGIYFKVSHKQFFRPDPALDRLDAVYPDLEVYRKIEDVVEGRDAQLERIVELIETTRGRG
jgi:hypothetical protein